MTDAQALSLRVAVALDTDDAWLPAERCAQGHANRRHGTAIRAIGCLCWECVSTSPEYQGRLPEMQSVYQSTRGTALVEITEQHPEWRIPRGEPKPFAEDANLLIATVSEECEKRGWVWTIYGSEKGAAPMGRICSPFNTWDRMDNPNQWLIQREGLEPAQALAAAFADALERWQADE